MFNHFCNITVFFGPGKKRSHGFFIPTVEHRQRVGVGKDGVHSFWLFVRHIVTNGAVDINEKILICLGKTGLILSPFSLYVSFNPTAEKGTFKGTPAEISNADNTIFIVPSIKPLLTFFEVFFRHIDNKFHTPQTFIAFISPLSTSTLNYPKQCFLIFHIKRVIIFIKH
ncbi:MAG: hypothetical protein R2791_21940 [Saprospiraceae bacterium]